MVEQSVFKDKRIVGSTTVHLISMAILLFAFWIGLSGKITPKFVIYGILTSVVTSWITYPLLLVENTSHTKKYFVFGVSIFKFIKYIFWLMWQLVLANIDVAKATTGQNLEIDPKVIKFYFKADNPMTSVVLANSITLTPGTVTINVTDDGLFEIHALTVGAAEGIISGDMQRKVAELYGEKLDFAVVEGEK